MRVMFPLMNLIITKWLLVYVLENKHNFYVIHFLSLTVKVTIGKNMEIVSRIKLEIRPFLGGAGEGYPGFFVVGSLFFRIFANRVDFTLLYPPLHSYSIIPF